VWCPSTLPPYLFFPLLSSPLLYLSSPLLSLLPSIPLETVGDVAFCASPSNIPIACVRVCVCVCTSSSLQDVLSLSLYERHLKKGVCGIVRGAHRAAGLHGPGYSQDVARYIHAAPKSAQTIKSPHKKKPQQKKESAAPTKTAPSPTNPSPTNSQKSVP